MGRRGMCKVGMMGWALKIRNKYKLLTRRYVIPGKSEAKL